jgi:hypothetical protein
MLENAFFRELRASRCSRPVFPLEFSLDFLENHHLHEVHFQDNLRHLDI